MSFLITFTFFYVYVIFSLGGMFMETGGILIFIIFLLIIAIPLIIVLSLIMIKIKNNKKKQKTQEEILKELQKLNQNQNK